MRTPPKPRPRRPSLLIHCQYVYGIGHFVRAVELAKSLHRAFDIHLVSGGEPVPNFRIPKSITFTQLPAIFKNETTGKLISVNQEQDLETCLAMRKEALQSIVANNTPDIIVTEHFPFGLLFEAEVMAMLKLVRHLKPSSLIVSSVRDVIDSAQGSVNDAHICALIEEWFDLILVHGDVRAIPLHASFPMIDKIKTPYVYTGYVVQPPEPRRFRDGNPTLVGAVGGGRVGQELLSALASAHRYIEKPLPHELILYRGAFSSSSKELEKLGPKIHIREFNRTAYRNDLRDASGVICLGGYNSLFEALSFSLPTLVYKRRFIGVNREQSLRADYFLQSGVIRTIEEEDLHPKKLSAILTSYFQDKPTEIPKLDFEGAANSCKILVNYWNTRRGNKFK